MIQIIRDAANWATRNGPYTVTLISIVVATYLSFAKDADINTLLPTLVGLYLGHKASTSVSAHFAASRDPQCDTAQVIREVEGISDKVTINK